MLTTESLARWNQDLSRAIGALGSDQFFPLLTEAICRQIKVDYPQIWLYHSELPPRCIYHEVPAYAQRAQIELYLEGPYREDPFYQISMNQPRGRFYRLADLIEGQLEDSHYYRDYYGDTATVDEVIYLARLANGSVINISLMRKSGHGQFDREEFSFLRALAAPIAELLRSHSQLADFNNRYLLEPDIDGVIDHAFQAFGSSLLSPREKSVLELMLRGYGSHASADRLGIALETLRRHRKSIYRKLDVSSQTDLFSLFINSLSYLGEAGIGDPLSVYMAPPSVREGVA
ncbi:MAG: helix-turn-helix transcriptional regulator [Halieaceae bacterium]